MSNVDLESLTQQIVSLAQQGVTGMTENEIVEHRKRILAAKKHLDKALGQTSLKEHNYDDEDIVDYVSKVLQDGYNLIPTKLSANTSLMDAQQLSWWKDVIKVCVQHSPFSDESFNIEGLEYQRKAIEQSTTLHELRQNVKAMIGPLKMYRELTTPLELEYTLPTVDTLLQEIEQLTLQLEDKTRVIKEITTLYDESLKDKNNKRELVSRIDAFKQEHNCSDDEACKVYNISRSTLKRMRKELDTETP